MFGGRWCSVDRLCPPPPIYDIYMNEILFLFWHHFLDQRLKCMTKKRVIAVLQCAKLAQCYRQLDRKYYACTLPAADATQFCFLYILTHKLSINEPCILWYRTSCHGFCVCICVKCMRPYIFFSIDAAFSLCFYKTVIFTLRSIHPCTVFHTVFLSNGRSWLDTYTEVT